MRALQLIGQDQPLRAVDLADPSPAAGDVVVRVAAAGICRSDTHYRAGDPKLPPLPRVLGHEVAGYVEAVGAGVDVSPGAHVAIHYQVGCGECPACLDDRERFCASGEMIGNHRDGGFAELIIVPARNVLPVPTGIDPAHAAVMMCSSVTALHSLHQARLTPGESVAVFGAGGLGLSAVQLARALGAAEVFAVDIDPQRLDVAESLGARPIDGRGGDADRQLTDRGGVDVAVELIGFAETTEQAVRSLRPGGRAAIAGLTSEHATIRLYDDLMGREAELIGVMDHTKGEARLVLDLAAQGALNVGPIVTDRIPLDAAAVNARLDHLEQFGSGVRTVIEPMRPSGGDAVPV